MCQRWVVHARGIDTSVHSREGVCDTMIPLLHDTAPAVCAVTAVVYLAKKEKMEARSKRKSCVIVRYMHTYIIAAAVARTFEAPHL